MKTFFFILLVGINLFLQVNCISKRIYKCNQTLDKNVCSKMDISADDQKKAILTFSFSPCPKESPFCELSVTDEVSMCTFNRSEPYLFKDENCTYDFECHSGICLNKVCQSAKTSGQNCVYDTECDPGYSCEKDLLMPLTTCKPLLTLGQTGCVSQGIGLKCFQNLTCHLGTCVRIGSLEIGTKTNTPYACKTFSLHEDTNGDTFCSEGSKLVGINTKEPVKCNNSCSYSYNYSKTIYNYTTNCSYGLDETGTAYCHPGKGNMMEAISNVIKWANQTKEMKCHYTRNMWCPIGNLTNDYYLSFLSYLNITKFTDVYKNSPCVQENLHSKYYDALKKYIPPKPVFGMNYVIELISSLLIGLLII